MTNTGTIILLGVCVGVGFVLEPLIMSLRENRKVETAEEEPKPEKKPAPAPQPAPAFELDLSMVTPEFFPEKVSLKQTITIGYTDSDGNEVAEQLRQGTEVKPLRLEGKQLVYETIGTLLESQIHVDQTNFKELVIPVIMEQLRNAGQPKEPEPEPEPEPVFLNETAIVALIKASVEAGDVKVFSADQVSSWEAGEDMEHDGVTYQTGHVSYHQEETILGPQSYKAIALIKNGKVVKWISEVTKLKL